MDPLAREQQHHLDSSNTLVPDQQPISKDDDEEVDQKAPVVPYSSSSFKVDFEWSKRDVKVTKAGDDPTADASEPIYLVEYHMVRQPNLQFKRCSDNVIIGTGTNKAVSINPSYKLGDRHGTIQAAARLYTHYTHESYNYPPSSSSSSSSSTTRPHVMNWKTTWNSKRWSFICYDESNTPIAKFQSNLWFVRKVGLFDFYNPCEDSLALKEELLVIALTMYNQMIIRINNPLSLIGAMASPHPFGEKDKAA